MKWGIGVAKTYRIKGITLAVGEEVDDPTLGKIWSVGLIEPNSGDEIILFHFSSEKKAEDFSELLRLSLSSSNLCGITMPWVST